MTFLHRWSSDLSRKPVRFARVDYVEPSDPGDPGDPGDPSDPGDPGDPGAPPGNNFDVFVRWDFVPAIIREGQGAQARLRLSRVSGLPIYINVRRTGGTASGTDFNMVAEGVTSDSHVTVRFGPGETVAFLTLLPSEDSAVEGPETLELTLDPTGDLAFPVEGFTPEMAKISSAWGADVTTIVIDDNTPYETPTWSFQLTETITVPEQGGTYDLELVLNGPCPTPVTIRVTTGTEEENAEVSTNPAVAGQHYGPIDEEFTFAPGETSLIVSLGIINDDQPNLGDNRGFLVRGVCTTDNTTNVDVNLVVTIDDDDTPTGPRLVEWAVASIVAVEPVTVAAQQPLNLRCVVSYPFVVTTDVTYTVANLNTSLGTGYLIQTQPGVPIGTLRFEPGQSFVDIQVTPIANGISTNATVTFALQDALEYDLGTEDELVVTILNSVVGVEPTRLAVQRGIKDGRTPVQFLAAVVPPSSTLPRFNIAGEDLQVIGNDRDDAGNWRSVWCVGMVAGDIAGGDLDGSQARYPGQTADLLVVPGPGSAPAESGVFNPQSFTGLTPGIQPTNVAGAWFERPLTANLAGTIGGTEGPVWEGPSSAVFSQVGADLRRTEYYRVWLKDPGDATADSAAVPPNARCCMAELWITRLAGFDVVIVEGAIQNTQAKVTENHRTTNPAVSGMVHFRAARIAGVPAGWAATWSTANPLESFTGSTVTLVPSRANAYPFPPGAKLPFRFAIYNTSSSSAAEAQRFLRYQDHAVAVGHYGATRQPIYGECLLPILDHARSGFTSILGNGYRGVFKVADAWAEVARDRWATGSGSTGQSAHLSQRAGWFQSLGARTYDAVSGLDINGSSGHLLSGPYLEATWIRLAGTVMRSRLDHRDIITGDHYFAEVIRDGYNGLNLPWTHSVNDRVGTHLHPHFLRPDTNLLTDSQISFANRAVWCLAPTTRPWNAALPEAPAATADEQRVVDHQYEGGSSGISYQNHDLAHAARYLTFARDGWWGCRSPLAYRAWLEYAAWVSRGVSVINVDGSFNQTGQTDFPIFDTHIRRILAQANIKSSPNRVGGLYMGVQSGGYYAGWHTPGNWRRWAWALCIMSGAYGIAGDRARAHVRGSGSNNWFQFAAEYLDRITTEAGFAATKLAGGSPNPYLTFGTFEPSLRQGNIPGGPAGQPWWSHVVMFHWLFMSLGVRALQQRGLQTLPASAASVDKILRYPLNVREASRAAQGNVQGTGLFPLFSVATKGSAPYLGTAATDSPEPYDRPSSLAEFLTGEDYWNFPDTSGAQFSKSGVVVCRYLRTGDVDDLRPALAVFSVDSNTSTISAAQLQAAAQQLYNLWLQALNVGSNVSSNFEQVQPFGESTFFAPVIAAIQNLQP